MSFNCDCSFNLIQNRGGQKENTSASTYRETKQGAETQGGNKKNDNRDGK